MKQELHVFNEHSIILTETTIKDLLNHLDSRGNYIDLVFSALVFNVSINKSPYL